MSEVATVLAAPIEEDVAASTIAPAAAAHGRAQGEVKKIRKMKGKAKTKATAKKAVACVDGEEGHVSKVSKPKPASFRTQMEEEVGDSNIEDIIKKAKDMVDSLQAAVLKAQEGEVAFEASISAGKVKMEQASANVDSWVNKETAALEKFKAARQAHIDVQKKISAKKLELGEEDKALHLLATEGEVQKNEADLIAVKLAAHAVKEEAKKAYEEAKFKVKEAIESIKAQKNTLAIADDPAVEAKANLETQMAAEEKKLKDNAKSLCKVAAMDLKIELKELEKQRASRDKERARMFKEVASFGSTKRLAVVADGAEGSPAKAKAVKTQDLD